MDRLIQGFEEFTSAYLDDLVIYSSTWEEHIEHIRQIFQRLKEAGLAQEVSIRYAAMQLSWTYSRKWSGSTGAQ